MTNRYERLAAARRIDWRFLMPTPALGRVACVGSVDTAQLAAIADVADEATSGSVSDLGSERQWDVVVASPRTKGELALQAAAAFELLRPGGWLMLDLPYRARLRGMLGASASLLRDAGAESVQSRWFLPNRSRAGIVVPLEDRDAVHAALGRRRSRRTRSIQAFLAGGAVRAGVPPDLIAGDLSILARRGGGEVMSRWPSLDPLVETFEHLLEPDASWALLTPRFAASAHVVLLLRSGGEPRLVAKIARLRDDDGPEREGRTLETLVRAGVARGSAPRPISIARTAGHAVLIEEALRGDPLDRRMVRSDPGRWIRAAATWLATLPTAGEGTAASLDSVVRTSLDAVRTALDDADATALVTRSVGLLAQLEGRPMASVLEHGDLSHPNVLVRNDGNLAVLDWELARPDGLPLHDLCTFLDYVAVATSGEAADPFEAFERVLAHPSWGAAATVRAEAARLGVDREALPTLVVCSWARTFASLTDRLFEGPSSPPSGWHRRNRYYLLWERSVQQQDRLQSLLS